MRDMRAKIIELEKRTSNAADPADKRVELSLRNDLIIKLQVYDKMVKRFRSQGFFRDLISNISGTGLHRLQALIWTMVIGWAFEWKLCSEAAPSLPVLNENLLAVMGISSAGYVGFKTVETNY
jgi:hypothetical protein